MYDRGEVVLIPFPYSDLTGNKKRPALIISNSQLNKTDDRICLLVTSKIHKKDLTIGKEDFEDGKLPFKSAIRPHRIFTIDKSVIVKKLCKLNDKFCSNVLGSLNNYLE